MAALTVLGLLAGGMASISGAPAMAATPSPAHATKPAATPKPGDFGSAAASSSDLAINGFGDQAGYHLEVGRESSGFAWHEIAVLRPDGYDDSSWTGYQCMSGDGRFAAVAILPASAVNIEDARDHGGFAYSVDLGSGAVHPIAAGVALKYYSPGCGSGHDAVFTVQLGENQQTTQLLTADLATGAVADSVTVPGQVTSAVPTSAGPLGVLGGSLVTLSSTGKPVVVAHVTGTAYDLRSAADGGVSFLDAQAGAATATVDHEHGGTVSTLGSGPLTRLELFGGRAGRAVLSGATRTTSAQLASAGVISVSDAGLATGAQASSLDGDALLAPSTAAKQTAPQLFATRTAKLLNDAQATPAAHASDALPAYQIPLSSFGSPAPTQNVLLQPKGDAAPTVAQRSAAPKAITTPAATQTPTCAVPRLDPAKQVMQPSPAQVNWAAQMAEQGLLTGSQYTRPAGFDNLGLAAYAPNSDFGLITLDHPSSDSWNTVPRSVYEAIMAQESNWSQASWHSTEGVAGDPLIADYYGAAGGIDSINYAGADCGYGIGQVTDGMHVGDTEYSPHGQIKIAVDYQENIAAGLQILESTWNQLYSDGIIANNGDPRYLENWYFAAWAYNSGIQPTGQLQHHRLHPGPVLHRAGRHLGTGLGEQPGQPRLPAQPRPLPQGHLRGRGTPRQLALPGAGDGLDGVAAAALRQPRLRDADLPGGQQLAADRAVRVDVRSGQQRLRPEQHQHVQARMPGTACSTTTSAGGTCRSPGSRTVPPRARQVPTPTPPARPNPLIRTPIHPPVR